MRPYSDAPIQRTLYAVSPVTAAGVAFTATVPEQPTPGIVWVIRHVVIEIPNYVSGAVSAVLSIGPPGALARVAGSQQGQFDSLTGVLRHVKAGESIACTWNPTRVVGGVQGRLTIDVIQGAPDLIGRSL